MGMIQNKETKNVILNKYSKFNKPFKKFRGFNKFKVFNRFIRLRRRIVRRIFKGGLIRRNLFFNLRIRKILANSKKINVLIVIKIIPNNMFCNIKYISSKGKIKTLLVLSAGILKLKVSRKKLRFISKIFIEKVLKVTRRNIRRKNILLRMTGPVKIKKRIIRLLVRRFRRKNNILLDVKEKKCFNGCLARKSKRKKRRKFRNFKSK